MQSDVARQTPDGRFGAGMFGDERMNRWPILLLAIMLAQPAVSAKVVEDSRYKFRADFPGVLSDKVEDFAARGGSLAWRAYTSSSPAGQTGAMYTATVKVFDTDSADVRMLFNAGESDASQSIGASLIGRAEGTFGADNLPSLTLSYQSGMTAAAGILKGKVLLVVSGQRLYEVAFYFNGADQTAVGEAFFQSFGILK
jgi:hypothetical protein